MPDDPQSALVSPPITIAPHPTLRTTPPAADAPPQPPEAAVTVEPAPTTAPPQRLAPQEVRKALRISTLEGAVANIHISITGSVGGSVFLTGFAILLGANSFQLGILGALPFIGQLFQFVGAYLEERIGTRRNLVLYNALGARLIWAVLLALPFLSFLTGSQILLFFFVGLALTYALNGIATNAWLSWMSDLVPPRRRGSYFGMRNTVAAITAMASAFLAGLALDHFRDQGSEALGYAVVFGVAVISAIIAAALLARQAEPPLQSRPRTSLGEMVGGPLRDRPFRSFILASTAWALVIGISAPFFNAYGLTTLQINFATLSLMGIVTSAVSLIFAPLVGRLQDTFGSRRIITGCVLGTVFLPWGWVAATPGNLMPIWIASIFTGVFWPGLTQGLANVLMDRAPTLARSSAIAAYGALTGFGTLVAGLLGGALAMGLAESQLLVGSLSISGIAFLFVFTSMGRVVMAIIFWRTL
ncbi:MAG: MFS transporter [Candidatus Viridilinea halotolerans]|uniref:MFS transporter n=1 Tax=Candidatus Viridilinea halotolerans TaxID=2491704 RepID=A0A426U825_9CHLR|nr:MAG: MFS transporter [Candidatus Viridilinea halotolerans]